MSDTLKACYEARLEKETKAKKQTPRHRGAGGRMSRIEDRVFLALEVARRHGQTDGAHHKAWVIDQMVRKLTGVDYASWVESYKGEAGPHDRYEWDEGIAP